MDFFLIPKRYNKLTYLGTFHFIFCLNTFFFNLTTGYLQIASWRYYIKLNFTNLFFGGVRKISKNFVMSVCPSVRPSVCPSVWKTLASTGRIFMKFYILVFHEILSRKFNFHYNPVTVTGILHECLVHL